MSTNAVDQPRTARPSLLSALVLLGAGWLSASPSYASVEGEWSENVSRDQSFSRVLVVGISADLNQRCAFERAMAAKIRSATTEAFVSCDVMPPKAELTRENIEAAVAAKNADAVLATSLISTSWATQGGRDQRHKRGRLSTRLPTRITASMAPSSPAISGRPIRSRPSKVRPTSRRNSMRRVARRWSTR